MLLTTIVMLPLITALLLVLIPRNFRFVMRLLTLAATLVTFVLALFLVLRFETGSADYQFVTQVPWVESLGISFYLGVDGINIGLVFMAALVGFAAACASLGSKPHEEEL